MTGRRTFLKTLAATTGGLLAGVHTDVFAGSRMVPAKDALQSLSLRDVHLDGVLGQAIDRVVEHRIMAQDLRELVEPFRTRPETTCWTSEFWGKWFLSAVDAYRYTQDPRHRAIVDRAARELMATQSPDGYIGTYNEKNRLKDWDVWGRKYTLLGLLSYHDLTGDQATLRAARRLADHLMTEVGPGKANIVRNGNYRGMPSSSILEPIVLLYRRTGEDRYLDFATYIARQWETPDGPALVSKALARVPVARRFPQPERWWSWENGQKAYEMMSCYEGLLELYRETGETTYLRAIQNTYEDIRDAEITVIGSGASLECWYGGRARQSEPALHMSETCVTMTWMKFCDNLLRFTGDARYADEIERSGYNALLGAQKPDGSGFAKYSALAGVRELGEEQCNLSLNCCVANAPRATMLLPRVATMQGAEGPVVNLYVPGQATVGLPGGGRVVLRQETEYPENGTVRIEVAPQRPEVFTLGLRIPAWSRQTTLRVNGEPVEAIQPGTYARVNRTWKAGDRVELELDMRGRLVRSEGNRHVHSAVVRGPIVLARDARMTTGDVDAPVTLTADREGVVPLERVHDGVPPGIWMAFRAGKGPVLVDYASAGNTWDATSQYRVWMPALYDPSAGEV